MGNDLVRAKVLLRELPRRAGSAEKGSFDENLITDLEGWRRSSSGIGGTLVAALGDGYLLFELCMKLLKVNHKIVGTRGCEIAFRMDGDARVITFVSVKWRYACSGTWSIIESKLRERK